MLKEKQIQQLSARDYNQTFDHFISCPSVAHSGTTILNGQHFGGNFNFYFSGQVAATGNSACGLSRANSTSASNPGIAELYTGNGTASRATLSTHTGSIAFGSAGTIGYDYEFEIRWRVPSLPTVADNFNVIIGFLNTTTGEPSSAGGNGVYVRFNASSSKLIYLTKNNSSTTFNSAASTQDVNTGFGVLNIKVPRDGARATFTFTNSLGTNTRDLISNMPTGSNQLLGLQIILQKSAGTNSRTLQLDYAFLRVGLFL